MNVTRGLDCEPSFRKRLESIEKCRVRAAVVLLGSGSPEMRQRHSIRHVTTLKPTNFHQAFTRQSAAVMFRVERNRTFLRFVDYSAEATSQQEKTGQVNLVNTGWIPVSLDCLFAIGIKAGGWTNSSIHTDANKG